MSDWDSITVNVATDDDYYDIELWSCLRCGSLVKQEFKETHDSWHYGRCPVSDAKVTVKCPDCEREYTIYEYELEAFGRFHRCYRSASLRNPPPERKILQDLIAELRGYADDGYIMGASTMRELCARVEDDLREVQGE